MIVATRSLSLLFIFPLSLYFPTNHSTPPPVPLSPSHPLPGPLSLSAALPTIHVTGSKAATSSAPRACVDGEDLGADLEHRRLDTSFSAMAPGWKRWLSRLLAATAGMDPDHGQLLPTIAGQLPSPTTTAAPPPHLRLSTIARRSSPARQLVVAVASPSTKLSRSSTVARR